MKYFNRPVFITFKVTLSSCYGAQLDVPKVVFTVSTWLNAMSCCHVNGWLAILFVSTSNITFWANASTWQFTESDWLCPFQPRGLICSGQFYSFVQTFLEHSASVRLFHCLRSNQSLIPHHKYQTWLIFTMPCKATEWRSHTNQKEKAVWRKSAVRLFYLLSFVLPLSIASF